MRVLVTGASGAIGEPVTRELLARGDWVRAFDRRRPEHGDERQVGELEDAQAVDRAATEVDAIVHLAAEAHDLPFGDLVGPNVLGLFHVLDAARRLGARRVVLASSVQVLPRGLGHATANDRAPGNHYALTKVLAEEMGAMYQRRFELDVIAARIGWMVRDPDEARRIQERGRFDAYLSRADAARFFHAAVHAEFRGFAVLFAIGAGGEERFDLETARRTIGYVPRDRFPEGLPFPVLPGSG